MGEVVYGGSGIHRDVGINQHAALGWEQTAITGSRASVGHNGSQVGTGTYYIRGPEWNKWEH